jgi:hypothetical protein
LESEVHEGTLVVALENLTLWAAKFVQEIPVKFIEWIPKGMAVKSATPAIRSAYLQCLFAALGTSSSSYDQVLIEILLHCIKKLSYKSKVQLNFSKSPV